MGLITFNIMNESKNRSTEGRMEWTGFMSSELLSFGDMFRCYGCSLPGVTTGRSITLSFEDLHIHPYCLLFCTLLSPALGFSNIYPESSPVVSTCSCLLFSLMFPIICDALVCSCLSFRLVYPLLLSIFPTHLVANPENSACSRLLELSCGAETSAEPIIILQLMDRLFLVGRSSSLFTSLEFFTTCKLSGVSETDSQRTCREPLLTTCNPGVVISTNERPQTKHSLPAPTLILGQRKGQLSRCSMKTTNVPLSQLQLVVATDSRSRISYLDPQQESFTKCHPQKRKWG